MDLSGAQLKYLSALHYQVVLRKCKIKRSYIIAHSFGVARQRVHIIQS